MELDKKYVLHIPFHKFENDKITKINMKNLIDDLIKQLNNNGYISFYMTKVNGYYKNRCFDEMLITIFASSDSKQKLPDEIFSKWFKENNNTLKQESFAYEYNNKMYIEEI